MVQVNEIYEIAVSPSDWNDLVTQYNNNKKLGQETPLEREIAGEPVRCTMTGFSWMDRKNSKSSLKQKIFVRVTGVSKDNF